MNTTKSADKIARMRSLIAALERGAMATDEMHTVLGMRETANNNYIRTLARCGIIKQSGMRYTLVGSGAQIDAFIARGCKVIKPPEHGVMVHSLMDGYNPAKRMPYRTPPRDALVAALFGEVAA